jgi:TolB protein
MNKHSSADSKISRSRRPIGNHLRRRGISGIAAVAITLALVPGFSQANTTTTFTLEPTIAFVSTRDNPTITPLINASEIYLMNPDGTDPRRLTENAAGDGFPVLSPDGKKIVFDSNRNIAVGEPLNTTELFLMKADGSEQTPLLRGGSASWSPNGKNIVFHRSASGTGLPAKPDPGAATVDSDIFVMNLDDFLNGLGQPRNITNNGAAAVDDDPDWAPFGQQIVFTSHAPGDEPNPSSAEIYLINADGTGLQRVTTNLEEERSPDWSPDGARLAFSCRTGGPDFEICVMNADGTGKIQLTDNDVVDLSPSWSPDGQKIAFQRPPVPGRQQIWLMNADGTDQRLLTDVTLGINLSPSWGELRVKLDA